MKLYIKSKSEININGQSVTAKSKTIFVKEFLILSLFALTNSKSFFHCTNN